MNSHKNLHDVNEGTDYRTRGTMTADEVIATAKRILARQIRRTDALANSRATADYLIMQFARLEHEVFACLFLDTRYRVIHYEELFRGTIDGCTVYPRQVIKAALNANAAAIILAHNHPSGVAEPSEADAALTRRLKEALALVDIPVIDHVVVGAGVTVSFAERGLL